MAKKKYYGVKVGRMPGVYGTWAECQKQVNGYSHALYKSFSSEEEANKFIYGPSTAKEKLDNDKNHHIGFAKQISPHKELADQLNNQEIVDKKRYPANVNINLNVYALNNELARKAVAAYIEGQTSLISDLNLAGIKLGITGIKHKIDKQKEPFKEEASGQISSPKNEFITKRRNKNTQEAIAPEKSPLNQNKSISCDELSLYLGKSVTPETLLNSHKNDRMLTLGDYKVAVLKRSGILVIEVYKYREIVASYYCKELNDLYHKW
jgi:viroplasmin and RNaseH domain-containing protein